MLRNKPDNGWVSWRRKTTDQHSRAACPAECHCVCTCSLQFLKLHACTKGCQWASASPRLTALQVHTSLANGECVRCHGGILSTLTQPPLPARLFQLAFQVGVAILIALFVNRLSEPGLQACPLASSSWPSGRLTAELLRA